MPCQVRMLLRHHPSAISFLLLAELQKITFLVAFGLSQRLQLLLRLSLSDTISTVPQCYLMVSFGLQIRADVTPKG